MNVCATQSTKTSASRIAGAYIGTVVGAGFASGQETLRFFGLHGADGLWGLALSTVLFIIFGALIMELGHYVHARSHLEVIHVVTGKHAGRIIDALITVSLLGALCVMAAGSGAAVAAQFGWPSFLGSALMMIASIGTVLLGINGVVAAISMVAPFLVGGVLLLSLLITKSYVVNLSWTAHDLAAGYWWPTSAVTYVSYNLVLALAVLAPMGVLSDVCTLRKGALLGGIGLGFCALATDLAILTHVPMSAMQELPMLYVISQVLRKAPFFFTLLLLAEIYTTAVANLYGFAARLAKPGTRHFVWTTLVAGVVALAGSGVGFARLVHMLYSAMGYAGATVLMALAYWWLKHRLLRQPV